MKQEDLRELVSQERSHKDSELSFSHLYHSLSLSLSALSAPSSFLFFYYLVPYYFEMHNLPPRFELIIKSERVQRPASSNEEEGNVF